MYLFPLLEPETFKFDMFSDDLFVHIFYKMYNLSWDIQGKKDAKKLLCFWAFAMTTNIVQVKLCGEKETKQNLNLCCYWQQNNLGFLLLGLNIRKTWKNYI